MADSVRLSTLRRAGSALKKHAAKADANRDGRLTATELKRYGSAQKDGFAVGSALVTMHSWARHTSGASSATVAQVKQRVDAALEIFEAKDQNHNGAIDAGPELAAARKLKTFAALNALAPLKPASTALTARAVKASEYPELNDYGKWFELKSYPATVSRAALLREILGYDDLSDREVTEAFDSTRGAQAAQSFAAKMLEVGEDERSTADDPQLGDRLYRTFADLAAAAKKEFVPARFKSVELAEHTIAEDGDTEHRLLIARQADDSWTVLAYTNFPF